MEISQKKSSCRRRDSNLQPSDPMDLYCGRSIFMAWPPSGTRGWALSSYQYPWGPCSGRQQAARMGNPVLPGLPDVSILCSCRDKQLTWESQSSPGMEIWLEALDPYFATEPQLLSPPSWTGSEVGGGGDDDSAGSG